MTDSDLRKYKVNPSPKLNPNISIMNQLLGLNKSEEGNLVTSKSFSFQSIIFPTKKSDDDELKYQCIPLNTCLSTSSISSLNSIKTLNLDRIITNSKTLRKQKSMKLLQLPAKDELKNTKLKVSASTSEIPPLLQNQKSSTNNLKQNKTNFTEKSQINKILKINNLDIKKSRNGNRNSIYNNHFETSKNFNFRANKMNGRTVSLNLNLNLKLNVNINNQEISSNSIPVIEQGRVSERNQQVSISSTFNHAQPLHFNFPYKKPEKNIKIFQKYLQQDNKTIFESRGKIEEPPVKLKKVIKENNIINNIHQLGHKRQISLTKRGILGNINRTKFNGL
jgi:hypothetical protein